MSKSVVLIEGAYLLPVYAPLPVMGGTGTGGCLGDRGIPSAPALANTPDISS